MKKFNILFLGGSKRSGIAKSFKNEGLKLDLDVRIFGYELNQYCPLFFEAEKIFLGKRWNDPDLLSHLENLIEKNEISLVIPFLDPAVEVVSNLKMRGKSQTRLYVSNGSALVTTFFNKNLANAWCINNFIKVPSNELTKFPLIAKPIFGSASQGIRIIHNESELNNIDHTLYLIQEFIYGVEYTVDCYVSYLKKSKERAIVVPRQRLETQGGESIKSITVNDADIIDIARDILQKSGLIGPTTIQFIKSNKTGNIYFMELNPRLGGGVLNSIGAGALFTKYLLQESLGLKMDSDIKWKSNYLMIRSYTEHFIECK